MISCNAGRAIAGGGVGGGGGSCTHVHTMPPLIPLILVSTCSGYEPFKKLKRYKNINLIKCRRYHQVTKSHHS